MALYARFGSKLGKISDFLRSVTDSMTQRAVERHHFKGVAITVEPGEAGFSLGQLTYVTTLPVFAWRYIQTQI